MSKETNGVSAQAFIEHVAKVSEAVGWQAGVGGCETAGAILSYLAAHPDRLPAFMEGGFFDMAPDPRDFHVAGRLSWQGVDGKVWTPEAAREAIAAKAKAGPPAGYVPLGAGLQCRCVRSYRDSSGGYWCCNPRGGAR